MPTRSLQVEQDVRSFGPRQRESSNVSLPELAYLDKSIFTQYMLRAYGYTMPKHQEEWCDLISENQKLVLIAPTGHGKTTIFSVANPIHEIVKNRSIRIGLVTNNDRLAEDILSEIKSHLEYNDDLINSYGKLKPDKPDKWSRWQIRVQNDVPTIQKKDATISAFGSMTRLKGMRFDMLLIDDLVDEKNSDTIEKCDRIWDWLWSILIPRCTPDASIKFMGTPEHEHDVYHRFMKNPGSYKVVRQQAILSEQNKEVLWPEQMPYDHLANLRIANYASFMKAYQTTVIGSEAAKISQSRIDACYDPTRKFFPHGIPDEERKQFKYILTGVDPAWTKNKRSKYAVIFTVGVTHDEERVPLDVFREKVEYDHLFKWIKTKYHMLRPQFVIVESNNMQIRITQELQESMIPVKPAFTTSSKNDVDIGIPMIYSIISAGKFKLPCGDDPSRRIMEQFVNEILSYPKGEYSDILMAYYLVEQEIRKRYVSARFDTTSATTGRNYSGRRFSRRYGNPWL